MDISDENLDKIYLNDVEVTNGTSLSKSGSYKLKAVDKAGNTSEVSFTISDRASKIKGIKNAGSHNFSKKKLIFSDKDGIKKITVNGKKFKNKSYIKKAGKYTVKVTDKKGTITTIKFTVDKTKPSGSIKNKKTYKSGKLIHVLDRASGIKSIKLDGKVITNNTKVTKKGSHKLVVVDKAGNKFTAKFKIK